MTLPRITLVTPSFNQGQFLEATIDSVLSQGYPNLEYMIVDGGSSDQSVEIIRRYAKHLSWWVSEVDRGQTDAIVKGLERATGELANWLNSDDCLQPGAFHAVATARQELGADLIVGRDRPIDEHGTPVATEFVPAGYAYPDCLRFWTGSFRYHQPPTFFTMELYRRCGGLDAELHYVMDFDLYCRMLRLGDVKLAYSEQVLSAFRLHGQAKTSQVPGAFLAEMRRVSRRMWPVDWQVHHEVAAMDRYTAQCLLMQATDCWRRGQRRSAVKSVVNALRTAPMPALEFALARGLNRASRRT